MSILGLNPLGTSPLGGPGLIGVRGTIPTGVNEVTVVYSVPPEAFDSQSDKSATNALNYTLQALDPTIVAADGTLVVPSGKVVPTYQPVPALAEVSTIDASQVLVSTNAPIESGVDYQVTIRDSIQGRDGEAFTGDTVHEFPFPGVQRPKVEYLGTDNIAEQYRDFAYSVFPDPQNPKAPVLVYTFDKNGDIAIQSGAESLQKRIIRRIITPKGGFVFEPGYGVGVTLKKLIKASSIQSLTNEIASQVEEEPDVLHASVGISQRVTSAGTIVEIAVTVQQTDRQERQFLFEVPKDSNAA